ncbi:MAG: hypothetical protein QF655_00810 [Candidatus Woesearchaeota archaeon]|jgi:hypothetical protein|nr:hypothetical protein [Candidatus Woesearchaeota archaeon]MDP7263342.1 hypothetical protein [Candidatus Woesearchaeota archaeon]MDP7476159.1 hypothetical protein [Candidatus Woesearchaeota archaeon]
MGILDKVMFWKKSDNLDDLGLGGRDNLAFGNDLGVGPGATPGMPGAAPPGGLGPDPGMGQGLGQQPPAQSMPPGPSMPSFTPPSPPQPSYPSPQQEVETKSLEVISSKLDAIRASIESLSQRMANLEAIARGEEEQGRRRRYY